MVGIDDATILAVGLLLVACGYGLSNSSDTLYASAQQFINDLDAVDSSRLASLVSLARQFNANGSIVLDSAVITTVDNAFRAVSQGLNTIYHTVSGGASLIYLESIVGGGTSTSDGYTVSTWSVTSGSNASVPNTGSVVSARESVADVTAFTTTVGTGFSNPILTGASGWISASLQQAINGSTSAVNQTIAVTNLSADSVRYYRDSTLNLAQSVKNHVQTAGVSVQTALGSLSNFNTFMTNFNASMAHLDASLASASQAISDAWVASERVQQFLTTLNYTLVPISYKGDAISTLTADVSTVSVGSTVVCPPTVGQYSESSHDIVYDTSASIPYISDVVSAPVVDDPTSPDTPSLPILGNILDAINAILDWLKTVLSGLFGNVVSAISSLGNSIATQFESVREMISQLIPDLTDLHISDLFTGFFRVITGYTLYENILSHYLPASVASFIWVSWEVIFYVLFFKWIIGVVF